MRMEAWASDIMSEANSERQNTSDRTMAMVSGPSAQAAVLAHVDPADPVATDHIASLPTMSLTAGLGSGDYVAVSAAAIVALLLGLASLLSFISDTLLLIPLAGLIVALVALRNIRKSSGTLTGRGMAIAGLVLSVAIGLLTGGMLIESIVHEREASHQIDSVCMEFGRDMKSHDYDAMYALLSDRFKARVTQEAFVTKMKGIQETQALEAARSVGVGEIVGMRGNGPLQLDEEADTGAETAITTLELDFANGASDLTNIRMRKSLDEWRVDDLPDLFPPAKAGQ
jgi:hypothetical protein